LTQVNAPSPRSAQNAIPESVRSTDEAVRDNERLRLVLPAVWARPNDICGELEAQFGDAQDFEFTVQYGMPFLLQTRRAKRTDWAAMTIAADMVRAAQAIRRACAFPRHRPRWHASLARCVWSPARTWKSTRITAGAESAAHCSTRAVFYGWTAMPVLCILGRLAMTTERPDHVLAAIAGWCGAVAA
jgi:hypothetical protein